MHGAKLIEKIMLSRSEVRQIQQLKQKRTRDDLGMFCVEGMKSVTEGLKAQLEPFLCVSTSKEIVSSIEKRFDLQVRLVSNEIMKKCTHFSTPSEVLIVFKKPAQKALPNDQWIVALDEIQDPGNLGTLMRTLDWFGFRHLLCSPNTVDCFNPKTVQASMGSYTRVSCLYEELPIALDRLQLPIYGADLEGASLPEMTFDTKGILVLGNEGHGLSEAVKQRVDHFITIPSAGDAQVESLNAAVSGAIIAYTISSRLGFQR